MPVLRVERRLHAEAAADVADQHADRVGRDAGQQAREFVAPAGRRLAARADRPALRRGVVLGERVARLDRRGDHALVHQVESNAVRGPRERASDSVGVAVACDAGDVARRRRPHERRSGRDRVVHAGDRRQRLVAEGDRLGRVARERDRAGDDRGDRLAGVAYGVEREHVLRRCRRAPAVGALEVARSRQRLHAVAREVGAGDHRGHARHRRRRRGVDGDDPRVRVQRAHEHDRELAIHHDVVGVAPAAGEQRVVLDATHRAAAAVAGRSGIGLLGHRHSWSGHPGDRRW